MHHDSMELFFPLCFPSGAERLFDRCRNVLGLLFSPDTLMLDPEYESGHATFFRICWRIVRVGKQIHNLNSKNRSRSLAVRNEEFVFFNVNRIGETGGNTNSELRKCHCRNSSRTNMKCKKMAEPGKRLFASNSYEKMLHFISAHKNLARSFPFRQKVQLEMQFAKRDADTFSERGLCSRPRRERTITICHGRRMNNSEKDKQNLSPFKVRMTSKHFCRDGHGDNHLRGLIPSTGVVTPVIEQKTCSSQKKTNCFEMSV